MALPNPASVGPSSQPVNGGQAHLFVIYSTFNKAQSFVTLGKDNTLLAMSETNATRFGFVNFAETWNGRLAMMGFVIGLGTELLTGQGILSQLGLG